MSDLVHTWRHRGRDITFSWLGDAQVEESRVYAFAFNPVGKMLVGGTADDGYWLPGAGIEQGETPESELKRELLEEAAASIWSLHKMGVQKTLDPLVGECFQSFYWCRVQLAESFEPEHEVTERLLVAPDNFLDTLFWGRRDPKAALLLKRALALNGSDS